MIIAAAGFGLLIGLAMGMLGGGGSVLAVPVLVYALGQGVHEATTASLVVVTAGALAGGLRHRRDGRVCGRLAATFTIAAIPGVFAGTAAGEAVAGRALVGGFGVLMLAAAAATWRKASADGDGPGSARERLGCPPLRVAQVALAGLGVGLLTGFFGVGGGFLIVPMLAIGLAVSMRLAIGTSLVIIAATSTVALVAHLLAGRAPDAGVTLAMTAACVAAAVAAGGVAGRLQQRALGRGFALLVTALATYLIASAVFLGGPPGGS